MLYIPLYANIFTELISDFNRAVMSKPVSGILKSAFNIDIVGDLASLLSASNKLYDSGFGKAMTLINNVINPIGIALIITFFLISVIGQVTRDMLTLEVFIKDLVSLVIVFTLASQAVPLARTIVRVGDSVTQATIKGLGGRAVPSENIPGDAIHSSVDNYYEFSDDYKADSEYDAEIDEAASDVAGHWGIVAPACAAIIWLIAKLSQIGMYVAVISRGIELIWRTIFMPIGIANSFEGPGSPGIRFIKNYIAVALSGAMVIIIIIVGQSLSLGILANGLKTQNRVMAMILAGAGLMATAGAAMSSTAKVKELFS